MSFKCNVTLANTGIGCIPIMRVAKRIILVSYFDSTGAVNTILNSAVLDNAFFSALVNNADRTKRWYPLPYMKNAKNERDNSITEGFDDNSVLIVQQGVRKFSGMIVERDASPVLNGKILQFRSQPVGCYIIDKDGNLIGMANTAGQLDPIRLDENSIDAVFNPSIDKAIQKIMLGFNFHVNEVDQNLNMITQDEMATPVINILGLLDINAVFSLLNHLGSFTVALTTLFGTSRNPVPDTGLVKANFTLKNITTGLAIVITTTTERLDGAGNPLGIYDFVFPAQSANDVIQLIPLLAGRDYTNVVALRPVLV